MADTIVPDPGIVAGRFKVLAMVRGGFVVFDPWLAPPFRAVGGKIYKSSTEAAEVCRKCFAEDSRVEE
jgi:hypothetical protein